MSVITVYSITFEYGQPEVGITVKITIFLYVQARLFDEPQLASLCLDTIDKNTMDAISAEGFTDIDIGKFTVN